MLGFFHTLRTMEMSILLHNSQNENDACDGLQPVICTVQMLLGTPEYVRFISTEILAQLNWILQYPQYLHSHNSFSRDQE